MLLNKFYTLINTMTTHEFPGIVSTARDVTNGYLVGRDDEKHLVTDVEAEVGDVRERPLLHVVGLVPVAALDGHIAVHGKPAHAGSNLTEHAIEGILNVFKHNLNFIG